MDWGKLEQLAQDEELSKKIFVDTLEQTQSNLKAYGIEMTSDDLVTFLQGVRDANQDSDELVEKDLDCVAGGAKVNKNSDCYKAGQKCGKAL